MTLDEALDKIGMFVIASENLRACYDQPHRYYHNLDHISEMLRHVDPSYSEVEILIEAILFHDIVHSPTPVPLGLNEALSIAEYSSYNTKIVAGIEHPFSNQDGSYEYERRVIEAINATAYHTKEQFFIGETTKLVLDLDLSTFALPREEYKIWKEKIEKENKSIYSNYTSEQVNVGRHHFLNELLNRQKLYYIKIEWEEQARSNIKNDIIELISH
jgi:predicted metal-dependent HD superfamily phosphohydrolase